MRVELSVNGTDHVVDHVWGLESLLTLLREHLGLRGSKNACEQGECGSCSAVERFGDGTPISVSREPSVPPRTIVFLGVRPRFRMASSA